MRRPVEMKVKLSVMVPGKVFSHNAHVSNLRQDLITANVSCGILQQSDNNDQAMERQFNINNELCGIRFPA